MDQLLFIVGIIVGSVIGTLVTKFLTNRHSAYGLFTVEPSNDPDNSEIVNLRIKIFNDQDLHGKNIIVLYKDSHK